MGKIIITGQPYTEAIDATVSVIVDKLHARKFKRLVWVSDIKPAIIAKYLQQGGIEDIYRLHNKEVKVTCIDEYTKVSRDLVIPGTILIIALDEFNEHRNGWINFDDNIPDTAILICERIPRDKKRRMFSEQI